MRTFHTGATRDTDAGKPDYEAALSPLVLQRFAEYMASHTIQPDGQVRAADNWQKGFGDHHLDVVLKSKMRHDMDVWLHSNSASNELVCTSLGRSRRIPIASESLPVTGPLRTAT